MSLRDWARGHASRSSGTLAVAGVGVCLSLAGAGLVRHLEDQRIAREFDALAERRSGAVEAQFNLERLGLESIAALWPASDGVEAEEFREFTRGSLARDSAIAALEWAPRVASSDRAGFELTDYRITDRDMMGRLIPSITRAEYFPVRFVEPIAGNEAAPGFDLASEPDRQGAMATARDTGAPQATPRVNLLRGSRDDLGILVFVPVYGRGLPVATVQQRRAALEGFAVGVYRVGQIMASALAFTTTEDLDLYLLDSPLARAGEVIASRGAASRGGDAPTLNPAALARPGGLQSALSFDSAGRRWTLVVSAAPGFVGGRRSVLPWALLVSGLLFTAITGTTLRAQQIRSREQARSEALGRELTVRREREKLLVQSRDAAEAGTRAKSEFLATMSHEIRTPLHGVIGMTELMLQTGLTAEQRDCAVTIRQSGRALLTVLNDVLDFSKIEAGRMELSEIAFDLPTLVEEAVDMIAAPAAAKGLNLSAAVAPGVPGLVLGDPDRLRQVLMNLVGNAVKFTATGAVRIVVTQAGDGATRFEVEDTGIGIAPEVIHRLFESFSQADSSMSRTYGGTGLGLAISQGIVGLMGGRIGVTSETGLGSRFFFDLPLVAEAAPAGWNRRKRADSAGRLLILSSDSDLRRSLGWQLERAGRRVVFEEESGRAALRLMDQCEAADGIDAVIVDLGTDPEGASWTIRRLRRLARGRLIAISGLSRFEDSALARSAGADDCIARPVRLARLLEALDAGTLGGSPGVQAIERAPSPARILLAEDNPVNQKVALRLLEKMGHEVLIASNGREAVDAVAAGVFDLVLMDCMMPVMDGFEATRLIRASAARGRGVRVPIIALTANVVEGDRERCLDSGMDDYMTKPFTPQALSTLVDRWMAVSRAMIGALQSQ